jgi:hypothetical protein
MASPADGGAATGPSQPEEPAEGVGKLAEATAGAAGPPPSAAAASHRSRTQDVLSDATSFRQLNVSEALVKSLSAAGFERPSPVQKAAIPLGISGADLIVQAKSGTGKTAVFAVICLERVKPQLSSTQVCVLAPRRGSRGVPQWASEQREAHQPSQHALRRTRASAMQP